MQSCKKNKSAIYLALACILLLTCIAYYPSIHGGFVWDDEGYILKNHLVKHMSLQGLKQAFTSFSLGNYHPLVILSYSWEHFFFGLNPLPYHVINIILHLINCMLVFFFLFSMTRSVPVASIVGLLFGIHPIHVESVAWISERKDLLFTLFYIGGLLSYLTYVRERHSKFYFYTLALFLMSLLSKVMAISFPIALFLIDYYLERKHIFQIVKEKLPFLALSFTFGVIAIISQQHAMHSNMLYSLFRGIFVASYGLIFYLVKMVLPLNLSALYPYPAGTEAFLPFQFILAPIGVIILAILVNYSRKFTRTVLFGTAFYLMTLFPALQFIPVGHAIAADRYTYVPLIGIFFILATFLVRMWETVIRKNALLKTASVVIAVIVTASLVFLTFNQCKVWKNGTTLWKNVIDNYPRSYTAHNNLGAMYFYQKDYEKALHHFLAAINIKSDYAAAHSNVCKVHSWKNENDKALPYCIKAIYADPYTENAYLNLGDLYLSNNIFLSIEMYNRALLINPYNSVGYFKLCSTFLGLQEYDLAGSLCAETIRLDPDNEYAYKNMGDIFFHKGQNDRSIEYYLKALSINPNMPEAHNNLAVIYYYLKELKLSREHLSKAISLGYKVDPEFQGLLLHDKDEKNNAGKDKF